MSVLDIVDDTVTKFYPEEKEKQLAFEILKELENNGYSILNYSQWYQRLQNTINVLKDIAWDSQKSVL